MKYIHKEGVGYLDLIMYINIAGKTFKKTLLSYLVFVRLRVYVLCTHRKNVWRISAMPCIDC